jgi:hypothetical protein
MRAYYFEFDLNRRLIRKTRFEHPDETYLRAEEHWTQGIKREHEAGLDWSGTDADRFRAAKVVALVRLLEPPQVDSRDLSWGSLSKFLVLRSWKGPFSAGGTFTAATAAMCYGPSCANFLIPKQVGQVIVLFALGDVQPVFPIVERYGVDESRLDEAARKLDVLAAQTRT